MASTKRDFVSTVDIPHLYLHSRLALMVLFWLLLVLTCMNKENRHLLGAQKMLFTYARLLLVYF
jgi:hypothetical protein